MKWNRINVRAKCTGECPIHSAVMNVNVTAHNSIFVILSIFKYIRMKNEDRCKCVSVYNIYHYNTEECTYIPTKNDSFENALDDNVKHVAFSRRIT